MRHDAEQAYIDYVTAAMPALRRTAYLLCKDRHRADDIVQAALTKLYVHWEHASHTAHDMDRYVHTMLVRAFLNEQRLTWARVRLTGSTRETPEPVAADADRRPDVETRTIVHQALQQVPGRQRAVLILRFLCDQSVADVAAILGCSEGNVKSQTSRGLKKLRSVLDDHVLPPLTTGKE